MSLNNETVSGKIHRIWRTGLCLAFLVAHAGLAEANLCEGDRDYDTAVAEGCTTIAGNLTIENTSLTDLDGLSALTSVNRTLLIHGNDALENIDGLSALTTARGSVTILDNESLENLNGLSSLTSILDNLIIRNNAALTNVDGLAALRSIDYNTLIIHENGALTNLDGLAALESVGGILAIYENATLTNVDGLASLTFVGEMLLLHTNPDLCQHSVDNLLERITVAGNQIVNGNDGPCPPRCGDGNIDAGEFCDDGDMDNGDGCSENCTVEECWECSGTPQVCSPDDGASCDDGEACTDNDECLGGVCSGDPVADNTPCDSGEACSLFDWCVGGACTGTLGTVVAEKSCKLGVESFSSVSLTTLDDRGRFSVGRDGFMADGTVAAAAVARLGINSSIYDLEANAVNQRRGVTIRGSTDPWVDSGVVIADLCTEPIFACDENNDVTLDQLAMVTLSPGSYGDLFLGAQAQLILEAGDFDFCRINGMPGTEIYITGSGPTVIRVRDRIITGAQSTLAPQGARAPLIQSGGSVRLGVNSQTAAHIQAPENTVKLSRGARLNGTVCARKFATARVGELTCDLASPTGAFVDGPILF